MTYGQPTIDYSVDMPVTRGELLDMVDMFTNDGHGGDQRWWSYWTAADAETLEALAKLIRERIK